MTPRLTIHKTPRIWGPEFLKKLSCGDQVAKLQETNPQKEYVSPF